MSFLLPLLLGFVVTGVLVAVDDFRRRAVEDLVWLPAMVALAYTYGTIGSPQLVLLSLLADMLVLMVFLAASYFSGSRVGQADAGALALFGLFPVVAFPAFMGAFLVAVVLWALDRYGKLVVFEGGLPLAGLLGAAVAFVAGGMLL